MKNTFTLLLVILFQTSCVGEAPLTDKPCPCATGQVCCESSNRCEPSLDLCAAPFAGDASGLDALPDRVVKDAVTMDSQLPQVAEDASCMDVHAADIAVDAAGMDALVVDALVVDTAEDATSVDAQQLDLAPPPRWQKLTETPLLDVASMNRSSVHMGDRLTIFTTASEPNRTWSYRFDQNDWVKVSPGPATHYAATEWTGTRLVYWGGWDTWIMKQGGLYDPIADMWSPINLDGALALSISGSAYTGQEVFMFGTTTGVWADPGVGIFYNPATDRWRPSPTSGAPTASSGAVVGLGSRIAVWGGVKSDATGGNPIVVGEGAVYDAVTNRWTPMATRNAPKARAETIIAFAADGQAFLWGGTDYNRDSLGQVTAFRDGAMYDPIRNLWTPISTANSPVTAAGGLWVEEQGLVYAWAGQDSPGAALWTYNPTTDVWAAFEIADLPTLKQVSFHWTGSKLLAIGFVGGGTIEDGVTPSMRLTGYLLNP